MKKYYGHQACPSCPSSDAFYVYQDGHGHCFSCGYHDFGTKTIKNIKLKLEQVVSIDPTISMVKCNYELPKVALKWLKKYGISNYEISKHGLLWNNTTESLIFPIYNNNKIVVTSERYFGNKIDHPKYLTQGNKTKYYKVIENNNSDIIVATEDWVSAIKVARAANAVPLLGTTIPVNWSISLARRFSALGVWLDSNKAPESLREANKASQYIPSKAIVGMVGDPKDYDDKTIEKILWDIKQK